MYHFNNVGSTMAVTDAKGSIVERYSYTPYGELIDGEYREDIPFLYNGQYGVITDGNGLYYMRARYYNVEIKRFINQDVLLGVLERVSSLNRYAYVEGNPISYLDPFGLDRVDTTAIHNILTGISLVFTYLSLIPGIGKYFNIGSIIIDGLDIGLSIYDMTEAIKHKDAEMVIQSATNIAAHLVTLISTLIGFDIEFFYGKLSNIKWLNLNKGIPTMEIFGNAHVYNNFNITMTSLTSLLASVILDCVIDGL